MCDLKNIKDYKDFEEKFGSRFKNYQFFKDWNKKRLKIGEFYKYDTSNFMNFYSLKKYHLFVCRLKSLSDDGVIAKVVFEDGKEVEVLSEYLIPY